MVIWVLKRCCNVGLDFFWLIIQARRLVWLEIASTAEAVRDQAKKKELWNTFIEAWFTAGETDPSVILIHVKADSAQYWDSPGKLVTLVSMLKAKVTGTEPAAGDSASGDL